MPLDTAALTAAMAAQPTKTIAGGSVNSGFTVTLSLRFVNGKPYVPADLLNALKVQYGATKITSPVTALPPATGQTAPLQLDVLP
jgi:hypothetical protein